MASGVNYTSTQTHNGRGHVSPLGGVHNNPPVQPAQGSLGDAEQQQNALNAYRRAYEAEQALRGQREDKITAPGEREDKTTGTRSFETSDEPEIRPGSERTRDDIIKGYIKQIPLSFEGRKGQSI